MPGDVFDTGGHVGLLEDYTKLNQGGLELDGALQKIVLYPYFPGGVDFVPRQGRGYLIPPFLEIKEGVVLSPILLYISCKYL